MIKIFIPIVGCIVFTLTDALTTIYGINNGAGEEANFVANFFMQHFGLTLGITLREIVVNVPFVLISYLILKWMSFEQSNQVQSIVCMLPFYIVGVIHLVATINNLIVAGDVMIESRPFPKLINC